MPTFWKDLLPTSSWYPPKWRHPSTKLYNVTAQKTVSSNLNTHCHENLNPLAFWLMWQFCTVETLLIRYATCKCRGLQTHNEDNNFLITTLMPFIVQNNTDNIFPYCYITSAVTALNIQTAHIHIASVWQRVITSFYMITVKFLCSKWIYVHRIPLTALGRRCSRTLVWLCVVCCASAGDINGKGN